MKNIKEKYSKELAITAFGLVWLPEDTTNPNFKFVTNCITDIIKDQQFSELEAFRFKLDLSLLNIFLAMYAVNIFVDNENEAKEIIDPMRKYFLDLFETDYSKVKTKEQFEQQHIILGDFIKRESERRLIKVEIESIIHKNVDMDNLKMNHRSLLDMLYPYRVAGYKQAIETQGNMGPMFSIAREFSRHFTGNEDDKENAWLVVQLSLLFSYISLIFTEYCRHNFSKK